MKTKQIYDVLDLARVIRGQGKTFNPLFIGPPGIGKSEIVQDWCNKHKLPFLDLRIAYLESPDMIGVPKCEISDGREVTKHYTPEFWPNGDLQPEGVVLLDEVNRGTQSMMNCMMQLLTDRKVHNYKLPEGWIIVGCINPENETNDVNTMDTPLRDRFALFTVEYDKKAFVDFMTKKEFDIRVINYVETTFKYRLPEDISNTDGSKYNASRSFAALNAALKAGVKESLLEHVCYSILGKNEGSSFYSFLTNIAPVYAKDLLKDEVNSLLTLKKYSNPEDYKAALISITIRDILATEKKFKDELIIKICLSLSADQAVSLLRELEFARKDKKLLTSLCEKDKELLEYIKENLADEKK